MSLLKQFEGKIDFEGQKAVETLAQYAMIVATAISFTAGFLVQSLFVTMAILAVGFATVLLAVVPPWPMWRSHPVRWLPTRTSEKKKA